MNSEIGRDELGQLGPRIGKGGQAEVYLLPDFRLPDVAGQLVYKQYFGDQSAPHGLRGIVRVRSKLNPRDRQRMDAIACWPARAVRENGAVLGVVMPLIPDSFFQERTLPSGRPLRGPREVQNLFIGADLAVRLGMPRASAADRIAVCRDLAGALSFLHGLGVVFGDVNAKNALFRLTPDPTVMLVDCDAVRIRGSAAVVRQLNAPDWNPPEGAVLTQETDVYKLGLFVLRTLAPGPGSSVSRDPERVRGVLDGPGFRLLESTLAGVPAQRPTAAEWYRYFARRTPRREAGAASSAPAGAREPTVTSGWLRDPATGSWVRAR
ncbi:hypothetical protein ACFQV2_03495 [Actinokineospora soli]|uniref:Protein kinase domain-containing protein n=1 Tax=Actinokineospora soli TaxID=1048753 RepID=A0ABW2TJT7_9PSEU